MSQENVEIVRSLMLAPEVDLAPLFRNDEMWAALVEFVAPVVAPDFECTANLLGPETSYAGVDGFRAFWLDWLAPWETYRSETEKMIDLGNRVLQLAVEFGRRVGSAQEVQGKNAALWTIRDGKVLRFDAYADRARALKAVGLEE